MNNIKENLISISQQIHAAEMAAQREAGCVKLLAVSKQQNPTAIRAAYLAEQHCFGENYVQEALTKMELLADLPIEWHFIGRIQANKTKSIAENFAWVHTVDRESIAERLNKHRPTHLPPLQVCIQINLANESQKAGAKLAALPSLAKQITTLPNLRLRGLMLLPPAKLHDIEALAHFMQVAHLQHQLQQRGFALDTLSMGTSHDFPIAIAAGSTLVRIGSAIFGERDKV